MDENLVGYLLNTLDPATHQRVAAQLRAHPEARARLERLREVLARLEDDRDDPAPPAGLVYDTLARVAEHRCHHLPSAPTSSRRQPAAARRGLRPVEWLVAACLLVLVGGLGAPLLVRQWQAQQRLACANNLRVFWTDLAAYADGHEGNFPRVEANGPRAFAGVFVPVLHDAGLFNGASVACPARGGTQPTCLSLAELERLHRNEPATFQAITRELAGAYAYCLGYHEGASHHGLQRTSGDDLPIMADRADPARGPNSPNHGGVGQNVLFVGGHVRWCVQPTVGIDCDDIYVNRRHQVRAGLGRIDSVLGASDAQPYLGE
jgi:hypothetical protein